MILCLYISGNKDNHMLDNWLGILKPTYLVNYKLPLQGGINILHNLKACVTITVTITVTVNSDDSGSYIVPIKASCRNTEQ